jgi:hypothetical protein
MTARASFPLFQMIYNDILDSRDDTVSTELSVNDRVRLCKTIKDMDEYHMELVYAIIRCYHLQVDRRPIFEIPYNMKKVRSLQFRFEVDQFPPVLQHILLRFTEMYRDKNRMETPNEESQSQGLVA